jgi:hypothetical protein
MSGCIQFLVISNHMIFFSVANKCEIYDEPLIGTQHGFFTKRHMSLWYVMYICISIGTGRLKLVSMINIICNTKYVCDIWKYSCYSSPCWWVLHYYDRKHPTVSRPLASELWRMEVALSGFQTLDDGGSEPFLSVPNSVQYCSRVCRKLEGEYVKCCGATLENDRGLIILWF